MESNRIVTAVVEALDQLQIPYMLVGSYSSNFFGNPRATQDADFVIQLSNRSISQMVALLGEGFELEPQMSFETITGTNRDIIVHKRSAFKIELFRLSGDAHDQARFARRQPVQFEGRHVYLPTAEDIVVTKLRWAKGGNRAKDVEDVRGVLATRAGHLDLDYIRRWCDRHDTRELFESVLQSTL